MTTDAGENSGSRLAIPVRSGRGQARTPSRRDGARSAKPIVTRATPTPASGMVVRPVRANGPDLTVNVPIGVHAWQLRRTVYIPGRAGWGPRSVGLMKHPPLRP